MQQAVAAGKDVHERTELGDVHDTAGVLGPDLGGRRIEDQFDLPLGLGDLCVVGARNGHDADHAVVVDGDVGAGLTLDGVDDLALRADDLTDLVDRDLEADDLRGGLADFLARLRDGLEHDVEDVETGLTGLRQRTSEHVGRNASDLGVELQGSDEVGGTGDLEVHVAERILGPEDVGEGDVLAFGVHETHGDTGDRRLDRHTGVHQRQGRATDRTHRGRTVRGHDLGDGADGVGPFLKARDDRGDRTLGERTVTDLATLRTAHEAGLTRREGREVVVVEVALLLEWRQVVDHHVAAAHAERRDVENLGLATLEEARAVRRRDNTDLGRDLAQVGGATTVDADALFDDALANDLLHDRASGGLDLLDGIVGVGELTLELSDQRSVDLGLGVLTIGLVGDLLGLGDALGTGGLDRRVDLVAVVDRERRLHLLDGAELLDALLLEFDHLADPHLAGLETTGEGVFVDLRGAVLVQLPGVGGAAGLDHHHSDVVTVETAGHDHLEGRLVGLFVGWERDPFAVGRPAHAHGADRALEGDRRGAQGERRGVEGEDVVGVLLVGAEDGAHHMDLVAEPVREGGTQRTVDETAGEDRLLAGPSLATEERAGDLARGVHALFDVDGQREEIGTIAGRLGAGGGDEDDGVAHPGGDRTAGERRELADLKGGVLALAARERAGDGSGFGHVLSFLETNTRLPVPSREPLIFVGPVWSGTPTLGGLRDQKLTTSTNCHVFGLFAGRSCYWDSSGFRRARPGGNRKGGPEGPPQHHFSVADRGVRSPHGTARCRCP